MTYYSKVGSRLIKVVENKEYIVGTVENQKLLKEIVCLLNEEV